jgi:glycosyl hydrolase family 30
VGGNAANEHTVTVSVDPTVDWGVWEGWGVSLAWWANVFGDRDDLADLLFTDRVVPLLGHDLPGLGLTIARYNLGACTWAPADGRRMVASKHIPRFKQIEGYWLDGRDDDPGSPSWNWSADPRQRAMLVMARDRGADRLELFANSPIWWMCRNHNPSGGPLGAPNLPHGNHQRHARHLATVAHQARDRWGIEFTSVEPFNEPSTLGGWHAEGTQEGCVILVEAQERIIEHLRRELDARGLDAGIAASDETHVDLADLTWHTMSKNVRKLVGRVNVHGYEYATGPREQLYRSVHAEAKSIWQSEYGGGDENGLDMAHNFLRDMARMHPVAWCYWQAVDETPGWGFLLGDLKAGTLTSANTKHWVFAQLSRHIRPGMRIIGTDAEHTVTAYDRARQRLVLVTASRAGGMRVTYDLSRFDHVGGGPNGSVRRWLTTTDPGGDRYAAHPDDTGLSGPAFTAWVPPHGIQTYEIDGVTYS